MVLKKAKAIAASKGMAPRRAAEVFRDLTGAGNESPERPSEKGLDAYAAQLAIRRDGKKVVFEIDNLGKDKVARIRAAILEILASP